MARKRHGVQDWVVEEVLRYASEEIAEHGVTNLLGLGTYTRMSRDKSRALAHISRYVSGDPYQRINGIVCSRYPAAR